MRWVVSGRKNVVFLGAAFRPLCISSTEEDIKHDENSQFRISHFQSSAEQVMNMPDLFNSEM